MLLPQTVHFPCLANAREKNVCVNAGHCAFEEQSEKGKRGRGEPPPMTGQGILQARVYQAVAPPLFS
jgi:hypothetical protein